MPASDSEPGHPFLAQQIAALTIGDADEPDVFSARLATENGWSMELTDRVISEYRRFLILLVTKNDSLTPSECVARAWRLHLLYTWSYWDNLCRDTLGRSLHHRLPIVGQERETSLAEAYQRTLAVYEVEFGEKPPMDIWPESYLPGDTGTVLSLSQRIYRKSPAAWFRLYALIWALSIAASSLIAELLVSGDCLTPVGRGELSGIVLVALFVLTAILITIHGEPGTRRIPYSPDS